MTDIDELAKRRGFFIQSNRIYGGTAGFYTYGPYGAKLKDRIENAWRDRFTYKEGNMEIDAPTVMPEPVFEASGHLDTFDDMIIECPECGVSHRADHLVEDNTDIDEAEAFSTEQIEALIEEHDLKCPECGTDLTGKKVDDFNLMFETSIGPGDSERGFLRPETAQGIFVETPQWKEYARNQLPFGVTQIGKMYRNEISPRNALVRMREATQAELELFIDPEEDEPRIEKVEDVELKLYSAEEQQKDGEIQKLTVREAVENDVVNNWVAYYLGLGKRWYQRIGVDMERFRFRQHLPDELSHYASDCWDAEADIGSGDEKWIELAGFAHRGSYDLKKHQEKSGEDFTVFKEFDEPRIEEETVVSPDMSYLGPEYGDRASNIVEKLEELAEEDPERFESEHIEIDVEGENLKIPVEKTGFETREVEKNGERIMPEVIEPSFGVDRAIYTVLVHSLDTDEVEDEERNVLRLPAEVAPTEVAVFPLMAKDELPEKARKIERSLREEGLSVDYDDSGAIGRRYRRQDEVGTPFCITVDYETLEEGTVTVRDRDTTEQERVPVEELASEMEERLGS